MINLLSEISHLLPDFSALLEGTTSGLSAVFWLFMMAIFVICIGALTRHWVRFKARLLALNSLLENQTREHLAQNRREILNRAIQMKPEEIGLIWREFDETLVLSADQKFLYNTLDAEHFFNARSLAYGLTASRLLAAAPSFLVAVGVLGTFVGLTVGLQDLVVQSEDVGVLREGIDKLIGGAAIAFMTSVWGVGLSVLLNFIEKMVERKALGAIYRVQLDVDHLYPRIPAEQSLVHIAEYSKASKDALQELHERIGERFQEAVDGIGADMQKAVTDALNTVMGPAIQTLVNSAQQQSSDVMSKLVNEFMAGIKSAGNQQGEQLRQAAEGVNTAVSSMNQRFSELTEKLSEQQTRQQAFSEQQSAQLESNIHKLNTAAEEREQQLQERFRLQMDAVKSHQDELIGSIAESVQSSQEQSRLMAEQHERLITHLQQTVEATSASSQNMQNAANQLGILSTNVREAAELLGEKLGSVSERIEMASQQNSELASQLRTHSEQLSTLQDSLLQGAKQLADAGKEAHLGFDRMREHQQTFLDGLGKEFADLGEGLRSQISDLESQAESWLKKYSEETTTQVEERMNEWNRHTREFTSQMVAVVQNISNLVDELESR